MGKVLAKNSKVIDNCTSMRYNCRMNNIKQLREKTGLSQVQFAKKYHIALKTIQNWEQGFRKPPEYAIYLLSMLIDKDKEVTNYD